MRLSTQAFGFTPRAFFTEVGQAARARWTDPPPQVRYLATYLTHDEVAARTMVVERPYIDRHYLQEFVGHYATTLRPVPSTTTRVHFFREPIEASAWDSIVGGAATEGVEQTERALCEAYLGYIVVRPLAACPVGRTALAPYPFTRSRHYPPGLTTHDVHLHGLTLRVKALPFQQQDRALGACATTAMWSAVARVMRADGGRAPTPLEVARSVPGVHAQLVASPDGLTLEQMRGTVRALGYDAHVFTPSDRDEFLLMLKSYVAGGIPVVLRLRLADGEVHATTIAGMRVHDDEVSARDLVLRSGTDQVTSLGLSRLYLHDDRLGPYARFVFVDPTEAETEEARSGGYPPPLYIRFEARKPGFTDYEAPARIETALVPLYPKIRTTAKGLLGCAGEYLPLVRAIAGSSRDRLRLEVFYALGGDYLRHVGDVLRDAGRLTGLRRTAFLSRYVGVLRFHVDDDWLLDLVLDTTDVMRGRSEATPLVLATAANESALASLHALEAELGDILVT